jgi:hypothetical protein
LQDAFSSIIARDSFYCPEIEIFYAVKKWHEFHYRDQEGGWKPREDIVSQVRLTLMSMNELLKIVRYSNLFDLNHLMDAIDSINDETKTCANNNDESTNETGNNKDLFLHRGKNYRGRLSKAKKEELPL